MTAPRTLRVGVLFPLSGSRGSAVGAPAVAAVERALELARQSGALPEWRVDLLLADAADPERAAAEAERLIGTEHATVLIGTSRSNLAVPASAVAARNGVIYWEANAGAADITGRGSPFAFRLNSPPRDYGVACVDFAKDVLAPKWNVPNHELRIAAVADPGEFGKSIVQAIGESCREAGAKLVLATFRSADTWEVATALRQAEPDLLIDGGYPDNLPAFWAACRAAGARFRSVIGLGAWARLHQLGMVDSSTDGAFCADTPASRALSRDGLSGEARRKLVRWLEWCQTRQLAESTDRDMAFLSADVLFAEVLPRAASNTPEEIRRAALGVDIPVGGTILGYGVRFGPNGDNLRSFRALLQWQGGRLILVHPPELAEGRIADTVMPAWRGWLD